MKKSTLNVLVDILSFIGFSLLVATGVVLEYRLPPRSGDRAIWDLTRHDWGEIHFIIAIIFLALLTAHIALHWKWIICQLKDRSTENSGRRLVLGIIALLALLALVLAPVLSPIENSSSNPGNRGQHRHEMTLP